MGKRRICTFCLVAESDHLGDAVGHHTVRGKATFSSQG